MREREREREREGLDKSLYKRINGMTAVWTNGKENG